MNKQEIKEKLQNINVDKNLTLFDVLTSESVYTAIRYAYKNPLESGMDNCDDNYYDLYNFIKLIQ